MYNVCYHSMAKSENGQENGAPDHSLTATLLVKESSENVGEIGPSESESVQLESSCEQINTAADNEDLTADSDQTNKADVHLMVMQRKNSKLNAKPTKTESESSPLPTAMKPSFYNRNLDLPSSLSVTLSSKAISSLLPPRGLSNLGNTCFFNSVLQCLARTPYLLDLLLDSKEPGEQAVIAIDENSKLVFTLGSWGPLTEALAVSLMQITEQTGGSFSPGHLLDALRKKHSQFQGFNQHDAHELLRTLLDCVKTEDSRRYLSHVLNHFGLSKKTNPNEVDEDKKKKCRELSKRLADIVNIRPDPVFKGITVSRNQCTKCNYKSEIPESFLDLSLPVSFSRLQLFPTGRRKNDFYEQPKSKHQKKKEKRAERRNKKLNRMKRRNDVDGRNKNIENIIIDTKDVNESGYSSPVQNNGNLVSSDNSKEILAEALKEIKSTSPSSAKEDSVINTSVKSNSNTDSPSSDAVYGDSVTSPCGDAFPDNSLIAAGNAEISNKCNKDEMASDMRFCLVGPVNAASNTTNSLRSSSSDEDKDEDDDGEDDDDENDAPGSDEDDSADENIFNASELKARKLCATLQPPTEDEDNSIQACLREYTKCEILTDNNKVNCEKCTKEHEKKTGEKKPIYRTFSKELLIKSPPPVLILHLKRFESKGAFSFRKVEKHILFPLLLDIGSFCSASCERLLHPEQKNIIYSLYGIVEHSGSLNAGHYVAYVKVRRKVNENSYRKHFLPKNSSDDSDPVQKEKFEEVLKEHKNGEHQWYYISDSLVKAVSEQDVLRKQAYLLFYERIW